MNKISVITLDKLLEMVGERKRERLFRVLAWMILIQLTIVKCIKTSYLRIGIWIEGSMGYPSRDVELAFISVDVVLSRTCMSSVFGHNEGLCWDEITQRECV